MATKDSKASKYTTKRTQTTSSGSASPSSASLNDNLKFTSRKTQTASSETASPELNLADLSSEIVKLRDELRLKNDKVKKNTDKKLKEFSDEVALKIKETEKTIQSLDVEVKGIQTKFIETLGIFVSLFTFISLDFSLLKNSAAFVVSVALILIAGGLLLAFLLTMHLILYQRDENRYLSKTGFVWSITLLLLSSGIFILKTSLNNQDLLLETGQDTKIDQRIQIDNSLKQ